MTVSHRVLIVDDEPVLLSGLERVLADRFDIVTAENGETALAKLESEGPFAVVMCDMRMPGMDGVEVLHHFAELAPDTVRMMLTGNADQGTAIEAVNRGSIFRFFSKPVPMTTLDEGIRAGLDRYRLVTAEKRLLSETVAGSVAMLVDVLSMAAPEVFQQSQRIRAWANIVARAMQVENPWIVDIAAGLALLGSIAVPPEVLVRHQAGQELSKIEADMIRRIPEIGARLIRKVPRLEPVADAVQQQMCWYRDNPPLPARILNVLLNLHEVGGEHPSRPALATLANQKERFDPAVINAALAVVVDMPSLANKDVRVTVEVAISGLLVGDVLESDIRLTNGHLILAAGQTISEVLFLRLQNVRLMSQFNEPVKVTRKSDSNLNLDMTVPSE